MQNASPFIGGRRALVLRLVIEPQIQSSLMTIYLFGTRPGHRGWTRNHACPYNTFCSLHLICQKKDDAKLCVLSYLQKKKVHFCSFAKEHTIDTDAVGVLHIPLYFNSKKKGNDFLHQKQKKRWMKIDTAFSQTKCPPRLSSLGGE